jgi:hypothetical protein
VRPGAISMRMLVIAASSQAQTPLSVGVLVLSIILAQDERKHTTAAIPVVHEGHHVDQPVALIGLACGVLGP